MIQLKKTANKIQQTSSRWCISRKILTSCKHYYHIFIFCYIFLVILWGYTYFTTQNYCVNNKYENNKHPHSLVDETEPICPKSHAKTMELKIFSWNIFEWTHGGLALSFWYVSVTITEIRKVYMHSCGNDNCPWYQGSWGQCGAHLGLRGPRWAPCWPHELCYPGFFMIHTSDRKPRWVKDQGINYSSCNSSLIQTLVG